MQIGNATTLANPERIERLVDTVSVHNSALGGIKSYDFEPNLVIYTVRFVWGALTNAEISALRTALIEASNNYVMVVCPYLGSFVESQFDSMYLTIAPDSQPSETWEQGYLNTSGPVTYRLSADFVSLAMAY